MKKENIAIKDSLMNFLRIIILIIAVTLFLRTFFLDFYKIPSESMSPYINPGDNILVSRVSYFFGFPNKFPLINIYTGLELRFSYRDVSRGDVIVFEKPNKSGMPTGKTLIKRVVGLPGDTVIYNDTDVLIKSNGKTFKYGRIANSNKSMPNISILYLNKSEFEAENEYFVLGDNLDNSIDSRYWGVVPLRCLTGKPILIF